MLLAVALTIWAGCGPGNGLSLAKVSGKVIYKGQPVKKGTVFFMPDEAKGTVGPPAVGSITSDGSYVMSTESAGDGVIVGQHKVGITGVEPTPVSSRKGEVDPETDAGAYMKAKSAAVAQANKGATKKGEEFFTDKGGQKYRFVVPMKYSRPDESGINIKVDRAQTVNFDIDESGNVRINP
jgi:hypothetical protein